MTQETDNKIWIKPLIIAIAIIVIIALIGVFTLWGLTTFFKYGQSKVIATEKVVIQQIEEEIVEEDVKVTEKIEEVEATEMTNERTIIEDSSIKVVAEGEIPLYYDSRGGVPDNSTEWNCDVSWDEVEIYTCGPGEILNIFFKGGEKRGTVFIMLGANKPGADKIHYTITKLIAGAGWQGNMFYGRTITEKDWKNLVDLKVKEMFEPPNASDGQGCTVVDVVVVQGDEVIYQKTFER